MGPSSCLPRDTFNSYVIAAEPLQPPACLQGEEPAAVGQISIDCIRSVLSPLPPKRGCNVHSTLTCSHCTALHVLDVVIRTQQTRKWPTQSEMPQRVRSWHLGSGSLPHLHYDLSRLKQNATQRDTSRQPFRFCWPAVELDVWSWLDWTLQTKFSCLTCVSVTALKLYRESLSLWPT